MMKFKNKRPILKSDFQENNPNWIKSKPTESFGLKAIFIGLVLTYIMALLIKISGASPNFELKILQNAYLFLIIIPLHELLHLMLFPKPFKATMGFSLKHFSFYVSTDEVLTKKRLLLTYLSPLFFLTFLPLVSGILFGLHILMSISLLNLLASGGDLIGFINLLKKPSGTLIRYNGTDAYIRETNRNL
jgi:hypothetical protein